MYYITTQDIVSLPSGLEDDWGCTWLGTEV